MQRQSWLLCSLYVYSAVFCSLHFGVECYINSYNAGFEDRLNLLDGAVAVQKDAGHKPHAVNMSVFC